MQHALECHHLSKSFNGIQAVSEVSLTVERGRLTTLVGPSGCGKTTTLRLIAGFETPDDGQIVLDGHMIVGNGVVVPPEERGIGMVFQEYALFPHLNVADNIAFGLRGSKAEKRACVGELLGLVGLDTLAQRMPHELSGGQQQRIALARALAPRPQILLLDEPFSNLDAALRGQMRLEVRNILKNAGITGIFVTHDQDEALGLSDQVVVLVGGRVVQTGTPKEVYSHPKTREAALFIGEANFLPGEAHGDYADCPLGKVTLAEPTYGQVDLLLRPEMIVLSHAESGVRAVVDWLEYYGHHQRVGVTLVDGIRLVVRADAAEMVDVGQNYRLSVVQAVQPLWRGLL